MSRGRWGILAAIIGCLIGSGYLWNELAPRNPNLPGYETSEPQGAPYQAGGASCEPRALSRLPVGKAANERQRCEEAAEEHRLKSDDLVQQTRAADAGKAITDLTYGQSRMILASAIIGFLTLVAALFAAGFAWRASEQGRISNEAFKDTERPRLIPALTGADSDPDADHHGWPEYLMQIPFTNAGRGSAHVVAIAAMRLESRSYLADIVMEQVDRVVHPGITVPLSAERFDWDMHLTHFGGFVVYRSSFGEHRSYFCYCMVPDPEFPSIGVYADKGDDWPKDT